MLLAAYAAIWYKRCTGKGEFMLFEYDPNKSRSNLEKHGIDFESAKKIWDGDGVCLVDVDYKDEPRSIAIGKIGSKYYTAVVTTRGASTRIISVRRSREKEIDLYERQRYSR
jgi:uncharacterized DUF497 family protein